MLNSIVGHWKTTLGGLAIAAGSVTVNGMTVKQFVLAFVIALLGALAHDPKKVTQ